MTCAKKNNAGLSYHELYETFKGQESPHTIQIEKVFSFSKLFLI